MEDGTAAFPPCFHRVTIKGMCVRDGKLLVVKEGNTLGGRYELPGGGLDFGEDIREGFAREVQEEMDLTVTKMSERPMYVWTHKYVGKRGLDWYYACVIAYRVEFADLDITPSEECMAVEFVSKDALATLDLSGQMKSLAHIFKPADFPEIWQ